MSLELEAAGRPTARLRPGIAPAWLVLAAAGASAWVLTVGQARSMGSGPGTMGMAFPFFVGMWVAMMAAMMLPAIGPQAAVRIGVRPVSQPGRLAGAVSFGAGFLVPWAAYGVLAFVALLGTGRLAEASPGAAKWLGVAIFAVAGIYQLTPAKRWALDCRMVMAAHGGRPVAGGFGSGIRDGAICVGCCWALMTILFAVGVMNLTAMVGLAALIFAEKILPRPHLIAGLAGVVFAGLAVVAAFHPSILSGLYMADMGMMDMGGM